MLMRSYIVHMTSAHLPGKKLKRRILMVVLPYFKPPWLRVSREIYLSLVSALLKGVILCMGRQNILWNNLFEIIRASLLDQVLFGGKKKECLVGCLKFRVFQSCPFLIRVSKYFF